MIYTYQLIATPYGINLIQRISDGAWIPVDVNNGDYIAYLAWLKAKNVPVTIPYIEPVVDTPVAVVIQKLI